MTNYTDRFVVDGVGLKLKTLTVPEFTAFEHAFGMASKNNDIDQLTEVYYKMMKWLEFEITPERFVSVFDGTQFVLPKMLDMKFGRAVMRIIQTDVIPALFPDTEE